MPFVPIDFYPFAAELSAVAVKAFVYKRAYYCTEPALAPEFVFFVLNGEVIVFIKLDSFFIVDDTLAFGYFGC
jgi:hypothetical protein